MNIASEIRRDVLKAVRLSSLVLFTLATLATSGCYERNLAPSVDYTQTEVDTLNEEIDAMDWE